MLTSITEYLNTSIRLHAGRSLLITALAILATTMLLLKAGPVPVIGLLLLPWLIIFLQRHSILLPIMWMPLFFLETIVGGEVIELDNAYTSLPILVSFIDIAYFFTLVQLCTSFCFRRSELIRVLKKNPFLTLFIIIVLISIAIYLPIHGKRAIGEARKFYFMFFFPIMTMLTVKTIRDLRIILLSIVMVAVGIISGGFFNFLSGSFNKDITHSGPALSLLFVLFSIVIYRMNGQTIINRMIDYTILVLCFSIIAVTQHRTVIMASILGLIIIVLLSRAVMPFIFKLSVAIVVVFTFTAMILTYFPRAEQVLLRNLSGIINPQKDATASWRIQGWTQLLSRLSGTSFLVGEGLGSYYSWSDGKTKVKAAPHNAFVQLLLKFGLLGLLVYVFLMYRFFRTTLAVRRRLQPGPVRAFVEMGIVNFGAGHAYLLGYGFALPMLIFFGLAMGAVIVAETMSRSAMATRRVNISQPPERPIAAYAGV